MAITHNYTLVCEQARMEVGGKFFIVGLFPNGIGAPQTPFVLPSLTFFNVLRTDAPTSFKFKGTLSQLLGSPLAEASGVIQAEHPGPIVMPVILQNLQFNAFGSYTWSLEIEGGDVFLTDFQVVQVVPQTQASR